MDEIISLRKKNGETLDASEWNKFVSVINYIIDFYNHYPTKLSEFENDIVD
jgi:predicted sulfurtransferase